MTRTAIVHSVAALAIFVCMLGPSNARAANDAAVEQATKAAESWLKLLDDGDYRACYQQASQIVKDALSEDAFVQQFRAARAPLGAVVSRNLKVAQYATSLPGAPDGQYVVIQYDSSFANKKSATETVTPMMDKDGQWRVSGYYIK
jgi:ABC-type transporter MlaC component